MLSFYLEIWTINQANCGQISVIPRGVTFSSSEQMCCSWLDRVRSANALTSFDGAGGSLSHTFHTRLCCRLSMLHVQRRSVSKAGMIIKTVLTQEPNLATHSLPVTFIMSKAMWHREANERPTITSHTWFLSSLCFSWAKLSFFSAFTKDHSHIICSSPSTTLIDCLVPWTGTQGEMSFKEMNKVYLRNWGCRMDDTSHDDRRKSIILWTVGLT